MSQDTPTNGRVTIAVVGTKVDNLTAIMLQTNANVDNVRRELGEQRQVAAVNEERWRNHAAAHQKRIATREKEVTTHADLHKRERGVIGSLIFIATTVSGSVSAWWASR